MKKFLRSPVARYLILGILAVGIGVNIFALNAARLAGNAVPMPFGFGASVVLSGSMEPALSVGDLLIIRERDSYETGDIVVYTDGRTQGGETAPVYDPAQNILTIPAALLTSETETVSIIASAVADQSGDGAETKGTDPTEENELQNNSVNSSEFSSEYSLLQDAEDVPLSGNAEGLGDAEEPGESMGDNSIPEADGTDEC